MLARPLEEQRKKELKELKQDFDKLKKSTETMRKKTWFKQFATTVGTWSVNPEKRARLIFGMKLFENIGQAIGIDVPKISALLPKDVD